MVAGRGAGAGTAARGGGVGHCHERRLVGSGALVGVVLTDLQNALATAGQAHAARAQHAHRQSLLPLSLSDLLFDGLGRAAAAPPRATASAVPVLLAPPAVSIIIASPVAPAVISPLLPLLALLLLPRLLLEYADKLLITGKRDASQIARGASEGNTPPARSSAPGHALCPCSASRCNLQTPRRT